jgi:hypothetical protein
MFSQAKRNTTYEGSDQSAANKADSDVYQKESLLTRQEHTPELTLSVRREHISYKAAAGRLFMITCSPSVISCWSALIYKIM